jgi:3-hexulose-6-phosphate synthase/6-phospho-3-hexuloisomerase
MTPKIQISLDVTTIDAALTMARAAVEAGFDWLEAGTPLILGEGVHSIHALREAFPDVPIVADIKAMDGAGFEADMMFRAGADMAVVMGQAHDASIIQQVNAAKKHGGKVMCDLMLCADKPGRARQVQELGVDIIIVHTGYDERNMIPGLSPLDDLPAVLDAVSIPVQAVGGLSVEQAIQTLELGAEIVVFGAPLVIGGANVDTDDPAYADLLRDIVQRVRSR